MFGVEVLRHTEENVQSTFFEWDRITTLLCRFLVAIAVLVTIGLLRPISDAAAESILARTNLLGTAKTSPKSSCAFQARDRAIVCVYIDWGGPKSRINLYEVHSADAGTHWSAPKPVARDNGDEYDPYIAFDSTRSRLWLTYAHWHENRGGNRNDVVIRYKDCISCAWSHPTLVAGDGIHNYWIPSLLVLHDGTILDFYTIDGPESIEVADGVGHIALRRSRDGGRTWDNPILPTNSCDAEYPRAIQNSRGAIMLVFSKYVDTSHLSAMSPEAIRCSDGVKNGFPYSSLHQVWSTDNGLTWNKEVIFYSSAGGSALHPFIGAETVYPQKPCAECAWDLLFVQSANGFNVALTRSTDEGLTWRAAEKLSHSSWASPFNVDPGMAVACEGIVANYTSGYGSDLFYSSKIDSLSRCK